jgi:hypothetical protein
MKRHRLARYSVAVVILLTSCASVRTIPIVYTPAVARDAAGRHDYETAVQAIAAVMVEDLSLPRLDSVLMVYPHVGVYEMGLRMELDDRPNAADRSVAFAVASCGRRKVLADGRRLAELSWPNRVRTLAHEMIHLAQFELADWSCSAPPYWLMEGFAEWGALKVVDKLGLGNFATAVESSRRAVAAVRGAELPGLDRLYSEAQWAAAEETVGRSAVYSESLLAVDFLIGRKGLAAVKDYFASFKESGTGGDRFVAAFGDDGRTFAIEFMAYVKNRSL